MSRSPETIPSDYMLFTTKLSRKGCAGTSSTKKSQIALCPKPELVVRRIDMSWITKDIEHCSNKEFVATFALASSLIDRPTVDENSLPNDSPCYLFELLFVGSSRLRRSTLSSRRRGGTSLIDRLLVYENCLPNVSLGY